MIINGHIFKNIENPDKNFYKKFMQCGLCQTIIAQDTMDLEWFHIIDFSSIGNIKKIVSCEEIIMQKALE